MTEADRAESVTGGNPFTPEGRARQSLRSQFAVLIGQILAIPIVASAAGFIASRGVGWIGIPWTFCILLFVSATAFSIVSGRRYRLLASVARRRPDALAFTYDQASMNRRTVLQLREWGIMPTFGAMVTEDEFFRGSFLGLLDANGVSLWRGRADQPFAAIPWTMITTVRTTGFLTNQAVILTVDDGSGAIDVDLRRATSRLIATNYQNDCSYIATQAVFRRAAAMRKQAH